MVLVRSHKIQSEPFCQRLVSGVSREQRSNAARVIDRERQELKILQITPVQDPLHEKDIVKSIYGAHSFEVAVLQAAAMLLLDIEGGVCETIFRECAHDMNTFSFPDEPADSLIPAPDIHVCVNQDDPGQHNGILVEFLKHHPVKLMQELQV